MTIETISQNFRLLLAANTTASSISAPSPTIVEPVSGSSNAVIDMHDVSRNQILLGFFANGSDNNAGQAMIYGWRAIPHATQEGKKLWIPTPLLGVDLTFGTALGVAGYPIDANQRFADTIAVTSGKEHTDAYKLISNANNEVALVAIDHYGCRKIEVRFDIGDATSINGFSAEF